MAMRPTVDALMSHLKSKGGRKINRAERFVSINEEKKASYDRFRGRVMFPVLDVNGNTIAFGARILDKGEPKYLIRRNSGLYQGRALYGCFRTRKNRRKNFRFW